MSRKIADALAALRSYNNPDEPEVFDPDDFDDDLDSSHPSPVASQFDPDKFMDDWGDFADVPRGACPDCTERGEPCPYESADYHPDDEADDEEPDDEDDPDDDEPDDGDPDYWPDDGDDDYEDDPIIRATNVLPFESRPYSAGPLEYGPPCGA